jgi:hypothetical protein
MKKKKKSRGRPDLPGEYWIDLLELGFKSWTLVKGAPPGLSDEQWNLWKQVDALYMSGQMSAAFELMCSLPKAKVNFSDVFAHPRRYRLGLQGACEKIMKGGPLQWKRDGKPVTTISDPKTLRARISEAQRRGSSLEWNECPTPTELWQGNKLLRGKGPRVLNGNRFGHEWIVKPRGIASR